jgi:hypothetical protein
VETPARRTGAAAVARPPGVPEAARRERPAAVEWHVSV